MYEMYVIFLQSYLNPLFPLIVLGTGAYFIRRIARAMERRAEANAELALLRERVTQLEESNELMTRDVLRLQAAQEFATRLLGDRVAESRRG
jgi:hypothetical protein